MNLIASKEPNIRNPKFMGASPVSDSDNPTHGPPVGTQLGAAQDEWFGLGAPAITEREQIALDISAEGWGSEPVTNYPVAQHNERAGRTGGR